MGRSLLIAGRLLRMLALGLRVQDEIPREKVGEGGGGGAGVLICCIAYVQHMVAGYSLVDMRLCCIRSVPEALCNSCQSKKSQP